MAVRRGVLLVVVLIVLAVFLSAAGLLVIAAMAGRGPQVARHSTLVLEVTGDLE